MPVTRVIFHASSVAVDGKALLIFGASGRGKSSLALELIALGATLIADDQTVVTLIGEERIASCPTAIKGKIEARGVGILTLPHVTAPIQMVIDLNQTEGDRLPHPQSIKILDKDFMLLKKPTQTALSPTLFLALRHGLTL